MDYISTDLIVDTLDILIVTFLLYKLFILMKGTRAVHMFFGLIVLFVLSVVAQWANLMALNWIISSLKTVWVIAFVIIFQPELRRLLVQLGQTRLVRAITKERGTSTIDEIVKATETLSQKRYGGLIVLPGETGIRGIVETGVPIRADVTADLIVSIFFPRTPLHDGAIVIRGDIIQAAKCILPLTESPHIDPSLGTRHRAALGVTEETDATVIVISEETGKISLVRDGHFLGRDYDGERLKKHLEKILFGRSDEADAVKSRSGTLIEKLLAQEKKPAK